MVVLDHPEGFRAGTEALGEAVDLVVVDIAEALGEDEGQDVVLVLRRFLRAPDRACRVS
jgi:hypothetical protein